LKTHIDLTWATPTRAANTVASKADSDAFNRLEKSTMGATGRDFTQAPADASPMVAATAASVSVAPEPKPITDTDAGPGGMGRRAKAVRKEDIINASKTHQLRAEAIYPPKLTSRLLCVKNLALPFRNRPFTYLVGLIYFMFAWVFTVADPRQSPITRNMVESINLDLSGKVTEMQRLDTRIQQLETATRAPILPTDPNSAMQQAQRERDARELRQLQSTKVEKQSEIDATVKRRATVQGAAATKFENDLATRGKAIFSDDKLGFGGKLMAFVGAMLAGSLSFIFDPKAIFDAAELSPMFAFMLIGLWAGLISYVESDSKLVKLIIGSWHAAAHIGALLFVSWLASATTFIPSLLGALLPMPADLLRIIWNVLVALFFGGLLGGFVMGLYWTLTSTLFNMHTGDAFGALGIKDYKNFLRIKLEPGRATIYPIALDRVPGPKGWRWKLQKNEQRPSHNPQILPVSPLKPRLIEKAPIVIEASKLLS
jgi:hypothetical protein